MTFEKVFFASVETALGVCGCVSLMHPFIDPHLALLFEVRAGR